MSGTLTVDSVAKRPRAHTVVKATLALVFLVGLTFIAVAGVPYFQPGSEALQRYGSRGWVLLLHIITGTVALLTGPVQLWLGLTDQRPSLHRKLGMIYIAVVTVSAIAGYYLAFNTDLGVVFGGGLAGLATAWLITTGMAFVAIQRHLYDQHKEWMIRSYVVTGGFVVFRVVFPALQGAGIGTVNEQLGLAAWLAWTLPLVVTEAILQGRKIFAVRAI
jgi:hypothetical protein